MKILNITNNPDRIFAALGFVSLSLLVPWMIYRGYHIIYLIAVVVGLASIIVYMRLKDHSPIIGTPNNTAWKFLSFSLLFCLFAWVAFVSRSEQYVKPLSYYILVAVATGLAFWGVLRSKNKSQFYTALAIACIIGLSHIWTEHLLFPNSLIGIDPWKHQIKTFEPLVFGALGGRLSLMHPYLKSAMELFGLNYKWSALVFVGSFHTLITIWLVYLLGKTLQDAKVGCVAGLMIASANWMIFFGEWIIPNTLGAAYSLVAAYLVLKMNNGGSKWLLIPLEVLILVSYFTHVMAFAWVIGTLACLWVLPILLNWQAKVTAKKILLFVAVPLLGIAVPLLLLNYTILGDSVLKTAERTVYNPSFGMSYTTSQIITPDTKPAGVAHKSTASVLESKNGALAEIAVDSAGMLLYFGGAIIGCLIMLRRTSTPNRGAFAILGLCALSIGFFPHLFGISVIEHRWWYLAEVLLAVPLGIALISFNRRRMVLVVMVSVITFLSTIGLASNMTNRALSPNLVVRYAFTDAEMSGVDAIAIQYAHDSQVTMGVDSMFYLPAAAAVGKYSDNKVISVTDEILSGNFEDSRADVLILRKALSNEPFGSGQGAIYMLSYDPVVLAEQQGYFKTWENEEVTCLMRLP